MSPLERLFSLEVEFYRRVRTIAASHEEEAAVHTSFALQNGYDLLLQAAGRVTGTEVEALKVKHLVAKDARDVLAAGDSVKQLLGVSL
jgi:hypothetical protein